MCHHVPVHHSPICHTHSSNYRCQTPDFIRPFYPTQQLQWSQYYILDNPPKRPYFSPCSSLRIGSPLSPWFDLPRIHCPIGAPLQPRIQGFVGNPTIFHSNLFPLAHHPLLISSPPPHLLPPSLLLPILSPKPTVHASMPTFQPVTLNSATSKSQSLSSVSLVSHFHSILVRLFSSLLR